MGRAFRRMSQIMHENPYEQQNFICPLPKRNFAQLQRDIILIENLTSSNKSNIWELKVFVNPLEALRVDQQKDNIIVIYEFALEVESLVCTACFDDIRTEINAPNKLQRSKMDGSKHKRAYGRPLPNITHGLILICSELLKVN